MGRQGSEGELEHAMADARGTSVAADADRVAVAAAGHVGDTSIPAHPADISGFTVRKYASDDEAVGAAMRTTHVTGHDAASAWVRVH